MYAQTLTPPQVKAQRWAFDVNHSQAAWLAKYNPVVFPFWNESADDWDRQFEPSDLTDSTFDVSEKGQVVRTTGNSNTYVKYDSHDFGDYVTFLWYGRFNDAASNVDIITGKNNSFQVRREGSGTVRFLVWASGVGVATGASVAQNDWVSVAASYDGANITIKMSVNGGAITTGTTARAGTMDTGSLDWALGGRVFGGTESGNLDHLVFAFSEQAISETEMELFVRDPLALTRPDPAKILPTFFAEQAGGVTLPVFNHHYRTLRAA